MGTIFKIIVITILCVYVAVQVFYIASKWIDEPTNREIKQHYNKVGY